MAMTMISEPTGEEPFTPVRLTSTSATERAAFRRCRRQWWLETVHRLDPQTGNPNFFLGTIYHAGLEAYYRAIQEGIDHHDAWELAQDAYIDAELDERTKYQSWLGGLWQFVRDTYHEIGELGLTMLDNYMEREETDPIFKEIIAVEHRVNVPIEGTQMTLSVQADLVGIDWDDRLCVADHKTASRRISSSHLDIDDQLTAEVWSWDLASGEFPEMAIYNVSMKKVPEPPKLLKSGKLSVDKNQATTPGLYREAIKEHGLDEADYLGILGHLETREDPFFFRERVFRTPGQIDAFTRDLRSEAEDMMACAEDPERAYPNPSSFNCPGCPVRAICTTIQDGGDHAAVITSNYSIAPPRR